MRKITQTNSEKGKGDCFPACIASILEQPLEKFPVENCKNWNSFHWGRWLADRGITLFAPPRFHQSVYYVGEWIAIVPSINNEGGWHAVVMQNDALIWDPSNKEKRESIELARVCSGWLLVLSDMSLFKQSELYSPAE